MPVTNSKFILGLDLGTSSIGWSMMNAVEDAAGRLTPVGIDKLGVRIFPEGLDRRKGEQTLNQERREARSARVRTRRTQRRKKKLLNILVRTSLLPSEENSRNSLFSELDPYLLRARAAKEKLSPFEIGRAFYNLAQRRGFLSNRKATKEEEDGKVKQGIGELARKMSEAGLETLGAYLASLDPITERKRGFYTSRKMFKDEFEKIFTTQSQFYPDVLTAQLKKELDDAIFFQRPLKLQKDLVGKCEFFGDRKRARTATLVFQEFRIWQTLNDLRIVKENGSERNLEAQEKEQLYQTLSHRAEISWAKAKKILGLHDNDIFNFEEHRNKLRGNATAAILIKAIGDVSWQSLSNRRQEQLVTELLDIQSEDALRDRLTSAWGFTLDQSGTLIECSGSLPKGYGSLSSKAMRAILPSLKSGKQYDRACLEAGFHHSKTKIVAEEQLQLPEKLRNPLVERALYQLRRVVNSLIKKYGKPDLIRVELARDLKLTPKQRREVIKKNGENERFNLEAEKFIKEEIGIPNPSFTDKLKYKLWKECGSICPYTGKNISAEELFGDHPQYDIEHILPYKRSLDDSFMNKTLCHVDENRQRKGNKTPFEAYSANQEVYAQIIGRVKKAMPSKLKRFTQTELELDDFVARQLNDTRYISRKAAEYLRSLGVKVEVVKGGTTAILRHSWGLDEILGGHEKNRADHRHHSIDALVIACTDISAMQSLSRCSAKYGSKLRIENLPTPFELFRGNAYDQVHSLIVSHKTSRKISGALHKETVYGIDRKAAELGETLAVVRQPLVSFDKEKDLDQIRDPKLKSLAKRHWESYNKSFKTAFQNELNPFRLPTKAGSFIPVRSLRVIRPLKVRKINRGYVETGSNYCVIISESSGRKGHAKWDGKVISIFDAVTNPDELNPSKNESGRKLLFCLHQNDMVKAELEGRQIMCRVQKLSQSRTGAIEITLREHWDAGTSKDEGKMLRWSPGRLLEHKASKIDVNHLGEVLIRNEQDHRS